MLFDKANSCAYTVCFKSRLKEPCPGCEAPYGFLNRMSLSEDVDSFSVSVINIFKDVLCCIVGNVLVQMLSVLSCASIFFFTFCHRFLLNTGQIEETAILFILFYLLLCSFVVVLSVALMNVLSCELLGKMCNLTVSLALWSLVRAVLLLMDSGMSCPLAPTQIVLQ